MGSFSSIQNNPKAMFIKNNKWEISSPLTYLCDNEITDLNQEYGNYELYFKLKASLGSNLQCNKYLDYDQKNKRNGRSKSNSVNHSHQENSRIGNF